jgi:glutamyl-tRNA synthetase
MPAVDALFPAGLPEPAEWEQRYPPRGLPGGASVTRFAPSPTGPLHIGGIYVAVIDRSLADTTGGRYLVRIEDTDQAREVAGVRDQFGRAFEYFGLVPGESDAVGGAYGPYSQSARSDIYLTYVRALLRQGRAYLCFATREELADMTVRQREAKVPTGYYGEWALWRDAAPGEVESALAQGRPYVIRFRSPAVAGQRISFVDAVRGRVEFDANRNDVVILKSSDQPLPLPTYHFAHAVDDHLMRVNLVVRGDEWLSSVPVHLQLFDALNFDRVTYAHIAPLLKLDRGNKRKLSKRSDPEASVDFYLSSGYPAEAVLAYLRGLINGRLAELPVAEALSAPIRLDECGVSGALVDMVKLDDICADYVASLSGERILASVVAWAQTYDPELAQVLAAEPGLALRALAVERDGVENPRKDLRKWSEFRTVYSLFFRQLFTPVTTLAGSPLSTISPEVVRALAASFSANYRPLDDPQDWFGQIRAVAAEHNFAASPKEYKADPERYVGSIREASQIIRMALTGSTRSPGLHAIAAVLGADEVRRRADALASLPQ